MPDSFSATERACLGSQASSPISSLSFLPEYAAGGVDVGDGLLGAVPHLAAEGRLAAGHRSGGGDGDVLRHRRHGREAERQRECAKPQLVHVYPL